MNGPHDIGGRHGFGPVAPGENAAPYHAGADWEERAMALTVAVGAGGYWTIDESRFAREDRDPGEYYRIGYFQIWLAGLERMMVEKGVISADELASGVPDPASPAAAKPALAPADVPGVLARGGPVNRDSGQTRPAFAPGDRVRSRNMHPRGHTRLPGYGRDKVGRIEAVQGYHVYADSSATGDRDRAEWLYTVVFDAETLWGDDAETPGDTMSLDAWEPYLDPA